MSSRDLRPGRKKVRGSDADWAYLRLPEARCGERDENVGAAHGLDRVFLAGRELGGWPESVLLPELEVRDLEEGRRTVGFEEEKAAVPTCRNLDRGAGVLEPGESGRHLGRLWQRGRRPRLLRHALLSFD